MQIYHGNLANTIYKAKSSKVSQDEVILTIENSIIKIDSLWKKYQSHFKRDEELQFVEYVETEIKSINEYFIRTSILGKSF